MTKSGFDGANDPLPKISLGEVYGVSLQDLRDYTSEDVAFTRELYHLASTGRTSCRRPNYPANFYRPKPRVPMPPHAKPVYTPREMLRVLQEFGTTWQDTWTIRDPVAHVCGYGLLVSFLRAVGFDVAAVNERINFYFTAIDSYNRLAEPTNMFTFENSWSGHWGEKP